VRKWSSDNFHAAHEIHLVAGLTPDMGPQSTLTLAQPTRAEGNTSISGRDGGSAAAFNAIDDKVRSL
jgi:hypothetical protein